ncbi:hypothetical protein Ddye_031964 [Dipteronia dyeriana]|uniref:WEB family protein n=1 Tax=Dipteronia dyeriana TaxID=168575 RepID=A0AAD9WNY8_9ROSI|nr:hypothetical protein Ddye_031964 [Dipteronia dyeriana]
MAETTLDSANEPVPGTPGIREVRPEAGSESSFGFCTEMGSGGDRSFGIRKVGLRAEIDTSPPFGSVKEAVNRFGGSGPWLPLYKLGDGYNGVDEEFDIKRVEEQAAELEKDLIVKELETLDVLEELGTTKKIVEELKLQIQKEALKCMATPDNQLVSTPVIKEMNKEHQRNCNSSPVICPVSSPDMILMELKQAKLNLGRTITDLGVIQTSVESLNKKMKKEKTLLEKTRERARIARNVESYVNLKSPAAEISRESLKMSQGEQFRKLAEISRAMLGNEQSNKNNKACLKTAEMRWVAAKKMEEAAKAAEALAFAEIKSLSSSESTSGFFLPEPVEKVIKTEDLPKKRNKNVARTMELQQFDESNFDSKLVIQKMLEEASSEVKFSKQALEEALNRIEIANRKQLAAGEALRRWAPISPEQTIMYSPASATTPRLNIFHPSNDYRDHQISPLNHHHVLNNKPLNLDAIDDNSSKPVLRPTVSMRDILSRKQVQPEECVVRRQAEGQTERRKVALSQMLQELREDLTFPRKAEPDQCGDHHDHHQKQFFAQRRKFGFIHISLPLTKQSKKKM